ncbi:MAG TPA: hypothetical protein V6D10_01615 [Trichocoleus sp.]
MEIMTRSQKTAKAIKLLTVGILSLGLNYVPKPPAAEAQVCNPFGCSQPGAGQCNPFGCPNPGAAECNPFGCPAGSSSPPANSNNATQSDINNGLGLLRQIFGGGNGNNNGNGNNSNSGRSGRSSGRNSGDQELNRILATYGLVPADCNPGVVEIKVSSNLDRSVCAIPTAQYPSGLYVLNQQDYSISPIGNRQSIGQPPQQQNVQPAQTIYVQPSQPFQQPVYQPQQPFNQPVYMQPSQPIQVQQNGQTQSAVLMVGNPSQPVPTDITAQITASLAGRGLSPIPCSANPGVTVLIGQYMACAYPTSSYPAGRYTLR